MTSKKAIKIPYSDRWEFMTHFMTETDTYIETNSPAYTFSVCAFDGEGRTEIGINEISQYL